jgi:hypothetical protein
MIIKVFNFLKNDHFPKRNFWKMIIFLYFLLKIEYFYDHVNLGIQTTKHYIKFKKLSKQHVLHQKNYYVKKFPKRNQTSRKSEGYRT